MNILAIGAHPDDIEIGCGGTLCRLSRSGHRIFALIMSAGECGGDPGVRRMEQETSARILGIKNLFWGGYRDTEIYKHDDVIVTIEKIVNDVKPHIVFVNDPHDTHQDHRHVNVCTLSATRHIKNVLLYEVPTTQNFLPNVFVNIEPAMPQKFESLMAHASQMNKTNIPDLSITRLAESMANFRGTQSKVKYAEGFRSERLLLNMFLDGTP